MLRVKLIKMQDPYPLKSGSMGTIVGRDDVGDYLVRWDCGSSLKLIPGVDIYIICSSTPSSVDENLEQEVK